MERTNLEFFREELRKSGSYHTVDSHRAEHRRKPGMLTTLRFSLSVSRVFPLCAVWEAFYALTIERWAKFCFSTVQIAEKMGMSVDVKGFERRSQYKGPVIYLCNHMSTYETIFLPPVLLTFGGLNTVAKVSLTQLPCLKRAAAKMGIVPLGRKNPRADLTFLLGEGERLTKEGNSFLIFPQGTRQKVLSRKKFSSIGAKLAERTGCPVVPIAIDSRCMPTRDGGGIFKDFGTVDTSFDIKCECGPVITGTAREMHEASFNWIATKLEEWGMPTERQ